MTPFLLSIPQPAQKKLKVLYSNNLFAVYDKIQKLWLASQFQTKHG
ncbi:hypothetical protein M892_20970 [Vibrio campbellii ATCC BAA-1116]|uniref:Uncharacterized protein n=1 Tax=Vibrio campbellii (strain ATCC BAA-1116) TaxID=2902295 RepID=A7N6N1_VIBC1|nr:hypothetical protein VIBHAR_06210 [Vibrio campbellii ATCC BAA-1116]AGU98414.1 hypothetical protein M892_20970 [Vibrio campbellii ATCC BAA-1116]